LKVNKNNFYSRFQISQAQKYPTLEKGRELNSRSPLPDKEKEGNS
jgi:hypothetical protein